MSRFYYAYIKLRNDIDSHIADTNNPHKVTASQVPLTDNGGYYSSTDIEGALQEIGSGTTLDGRYVLKTGDTMGGVLLLYNESKVYNPGGQQGNYHARFYLQTFATGTAYNDGFMFGMDADSVARISARRGTTRLEIGTFADASTNAPVYILSYGQTVAIFSPTGLGLGGVTPSTRLDIGAGAIEMEEITDPGPGAANTVRLYSRDDGAGLTELMAVFNTGDPLVLGVQGLTVPTYTLSNVTVTRTLDPTTATVTDVANVLATLIQDLQARRLIKPYI